MLLAVLRLRCYYRKLAVENWKTDLKRKIKRLEEENKELRGLLKVAYAGIQEDITGITLTEQGTGIQYLYLII